MRYLALTEGRSFTYHDFQSVEFNGKTYGMSHKTYRNKIWRFKKAGLAETESNSGIAFYTLKDVHFGKRKKDTMMMTLKLIEHMQDRGRAILWITRCVTALLLMRKQLGKPFRYASKDDIRNVLKWMEQKGYKASINEKFRQVLKLYYRLLS